MIHRLLLEAILVGVVVTIIGFPSSMLAIKMMPIKNNQDHRPVMYFSLFLTGIFSHLIFEILQINSYYCSHGYACSR